MSQRELRTKLKPGENHVAMPLLNATLLWLLGLLRGSAAAERHLQRGVLCVALLDYARLPGPLQPLFSVA
jgi:hypothetical protein